MVNYHDADFPTLFQGFAMPAAYSYLRFSSPQQASGDSIRRQTQARDTWLAAHPDVKLDASLVMTDAGRSGFNRKDWDTYALAQFVAHVKSGRVAKGSYLLVENLDRLSRENAGEATELFLSIVNKGVVIVQLSPAVMEFRKPVDMTSLMFAIVELSRGHSESAIKSERSRASWARKQKEAASRVVTRMLPGWISSEGGKLVLNKHAATVRCMFGMARDGLGTQAIALKLNVDKVPTLGRKTFRGRPVKWSGANVWHILTSPAAIGKYVPYRKRGEAAGSPIPNYFPAVVDEATYHAVRQAITARGRVGRGRRGKHINLFSGLLIDARDGGSLSYWKPGAHPTVLISVNAKEGKGIDWVSFPADLFDAAVLSQLSEITSADVEGGAAAGKVDELRGKRDELDGLIALWTGKMDNPLLVDTVAAKLADLQLRRRKVVEELAEAEHEAATPLAEVWGDYLSLAALLKRDNSDDMRGKVRTVLRRCIESVTCLFVRRGTVRLAAVQVQFRGTDAHRDYLITARQKSGGTAPRPAAWDVRSFADACPGRGGLDLRDPKHATAVGAVLAKLDVSQLAAK
jgi:DNA invertase Pin-like site-specific DNA recombinase